LRFSFPNCFPISRSSLRLSQLVRGFRHDAQH